MEKITGIRSIDFKVKALGHGVVNWNGPTTLTGDDGKKTVDNHTLPKLRGYTNLTGRTKETEKGGIYHYKKHAEEIDFKKTPLYISQNCIRHHLFREQAFDLHFASEKNVQKIISSETGLLRGFVVPSSQNKRTSPLLIEDFVDQLGNGNFEQFGQAGTRDSSSFFSKTTFGDTEYQSYGSISIEQLQFIALDNKFDRAAMSLKKNQGEEVAKEVVAFIESLPHEGKPEAIFHENYVRKGTIFEEGEAGILLNQDAVMILVKHMLGKIKNLSIRQAKGYMYVDDILIDYNDSTQMMRIKSDETKISEEKGSDFATYFYQGAS